MGLFIHMHAQEGSLEKVGKGMGTLGREDQTSDSALPTCDVMQHPPKLFKRTVKKGQSWFWIYYVHLNT